MYNGAIHQVPNRVDRWPRLVGDTWLPTASVWLAPFFPRNFSHTNLTGLSPKSNNRNILQHSQSSQPSEYSTKCPPLTLKPTHKPVKSYYAALDQFARLGVTHETAVRAAFQTLLETCARQCGWTLVPEFALNTPPRQAHRRRRRAGRRLPPHARLLGGQGHRRRPARRSRAQVPGRLPRDNILFQTPQRAMLCSTDAWPSTPT